ncbi:ATP synthase subunit I [Acidihalobacter prosperus]
MRSAIMLIQAGLVLIGVVVAAYSKGQHGVEAALYGGAVAMANTLILARRMERVGMVDAASAQRGMIQLYVNAVLRFVFVLAALAIGLGVLKLMPLPLVGTFIGAQVAYMLVSVRSRSK